MDLYDYSSEKSHRFDTDPSRGASRISRATNSLQDQEVPNLPAGNACDDAGQCSTVDEALKVIHASFPFTPSVQTVAGQVGVHRSHLARVFRKSAGTSISEYVRELRIEMAKRLLTTTDKSLAVIAAECGFSGQSHFTRCFRAITRSTPGKWRRQIDDASRSLPAQRSPLPPKASH